MSTAPESQSGRLATFAQVSAPAWPVGHIGGHNGHLKRPRSVVADHRPTHRDHRDTPNRKA